MTIPCHLLDMDGVLVRGMAEIDGSVAYLDLLRAHDVPFMVFTNNSRFAPETHAERLRSIGFPVEAENIYTSALATARFLRQQKPGATVFAVGDDGLRMALERAGCILTRSAPDFVVVGESLDYDYAELALATRLVGDGARFIGTNPDVSGPVEDGQHPACGAACALIEASTGKRPYFLGKPNPYMMRAALDRLGVRAAQAIMVGDRMDTDVLAGLELGLKTALVLTGSSDRATIGLHPYRPDLVIDRLHDLAGHFELG